MPISGNEETGVKPLAQQSSIDIAGVPIKKRRFMRPLSPPEEQSSPAEQHASLSQESAPSIVAASFSGKSEVNNNILLEENEKGLDSSAGTKTNILSRVRTEEQSLTIQSGSLPKLCDGVKLAVTENLDNILTNSSKTELNLTSDVGKELYGQQMVKGKGKSETPTLSGSLGLSLSLKEQSISALEDHGHDGSGQGLEYVEPVSLNLSLSKVESSTQVKKDDSQLTIDSANVHANRSNWDLNTTMDAWESYAGEVIDDGFNTAGVGHNIKSFISSTGKVVTGITTDKPLNQEGDQASSFTRTFQESNSFEDSLHLGLSPSFLSVGSNQDPSPSLSNKETCRVVPNMGLSRGLLVNNTDTVNSMTIKREPVDENHKFDFMASKANLMRSLDFKAVKHELVEKFGHEALKFPNFGALNLVDPKIIKREPLHDSTPGREKTVEGASNQSGQQVLQRQDKIGHPTCSAHKHELQCQDIGGQSTCSKDRQLPHGLDTGATSSCSKQLCTSSNAQDNSEPCSGAEAASLTMEALKEASENNGQVTPKTISLPIGDNSNEINVSLSAVSGTVDTAANLTEPLHVSTPGTEKTIEGTSNQSGQQVLPGQDKRGHPTCSAHEHELQGQDIGGQPTCSKDKQVPHGLDSGAKSSCPKQLCTSSSAQDNLESCSGAELASLTMEVPEEASKNTGQVTPKMISLPVGDNNNEVNVSGTVDTAVTEDKNIESPEQCNQELIDEPSLGSHRNGEVTVSDEEKINLSGDMLEEDSFGSEYESDGNSVPMDIDEDGRERNDYEDGEVQEQQLCTAVGGSLCESKEDVTHGVSDKQIVNSAELPSDDQPNSSHAMEKDTERENAVETNKDTAKEFFDSSYDQKTIDDAIKDPSKKEPLAVEMPASVVDKQTGAADKSKAMKTIKRKLVDLSGNIDALDKCIENSSDQAPNGAPDQASNGGEETSMTVTTQSPCDIVKINGVEDNDSVLLEVDPSLNSDDAAKNANSVGNRSRIINLSRASNMSSPGKTRSITGKLLASRPGRESLPDVPFEGDKLHPRGRDGIYNDGSHKFSRERHQDQSSRNSGLNFIHARRVSSRNDTVHGDRNSNRTFAPEFYSSHSDFSVPRRKYASGVSMADGEFINYNVGQDSAFVGNIRGGRKLQDNQTSMFRNLTSGKQSPGGRDGPAACGFQMVRRVPRTISEEGSEVVGLRQGEKVMRGFPGDGADHAFLHPHTPFDGLGGHFVQGTRNILSVQRRAPPQIHSKSPIRSRSPGPWSSSRRRPPDGICGLPDLPHRRSPPIYRLERMRSPDHPGFTGEMMVRRHGSPSFLSRPNDLREMGPGRDHGHPRSIITNRSPNSRVLLKNNRRFGVVDPRERTDGDEFFRGPMHSGRFHELGGDANGGDRRRFADRRGLVRPFRPPFSGGNSENFHLNPENVPRTFRFLPEDEQGFPERPNLRGREFDRPMKNRPLNAPRRPRGIEEQEGNYRHGGQVMYEDGFDDMSRLKKKRFD